MKWQFGSTSGVGCQDSTFTIKKLIYLRQIYNLPTYVAFSDLVKAFEISNHALLIAIFFESITNIERGITPLSDHFAWFGLGIYIST